MDKRTIHMSVSRFQKEVFEEYPPKKRRELSDIIILSILESLLQLQKNKKLSFRILDVGCGGGQLLKSLLKNMDGVEIFGIDISKKALKSAQKYGYRVFLCDVEKEKLPFKNDVFDVVIINDLLEHIIDPDNLLKEVRRVVKVDGRVIINVPNISHPVSWFMQIFLDLPPMQSARYKSPHVRDYTLRMLKLVLKINGFKIEKIKGTYIYPFNNKVSRAIANLFPRLSERIIVICKKDNPPKEIPSVTFNLRELLEYERT